MSAATDLAADDTDGESFPVDVGKSIDIERIGLSVTYTGYLAYLTIYLTSPDGQEFELVSKAGFVLGGARTETFEFQSQQYRGVDSAGDWSVRMVNKSGTSMNVSNLTLDFHGAANSSNDTYVYTNEFSDYAGTSGHSRKLRDTDDGVDLLNASAVTAAMAVDLAGKTGKIDGVAMKISGIENVFGGDGKDRLTGSTANNDLAGGRGEDILVGGKGNDDFIYRVISDSLTGKKCDLIKDFDNGKDRIDLSDIDTSAKAGDQGFRFIGDDQSFNGKHGELRFLLFDKSGTSNDRTMVEADLDGNKHADFQIELAGLHQLAKGDFIF